MACPGCSEACQPQVSPLLDQPPSTEATADGIFTKTLGPLAAGSFVPQHSHATAHMTVIVSGRVRVIVDGTVRSEKSAPAAILIPALVMHMFEVLADNTRLLCVHDVSAAPVVIVAEHQLTSAA